MTNVFNTKKPPPAPTFQQTNANAQTAATEATKQQMLLNQDALQKTQAATQIGQNTPIGNMQYVKTGTDSKGNPTYSLNASYSAPQQQLYDQTVGTKQAAGAQAKSLAASSAPMYSDANTMLQNIFSGADSLTGQRVNAALGFQQPFMQQDRAYLDTQLRSQGIQPGDPAYQRQMAELDKQQYGNQQNFIANVMPQSQQTAQNAYMLPLQTQQQLAQQGAPDALTQLNTPTFNMNNADYTGTYGYSVDSQNKSYANQLAAVNAQNQQKSNMMTGIFGAAGAAVGSPLGAAVYNSYSPVPGK